jgi:hypothetical protein
VRRQRIVAEVAVRSLMRDEIEERFGVGHGRNSVHRVMMATPAVPGAP